MNNDMLKSVKKLSEMRWHFRIPYYQRGYRWKRQQVWQLLEDLNAFRSCEETPFYFLQALAIAHGGKEYRVVDGQQRLTTLKLILSTLMEKDVELHGVSIEIEYDRDADGTIDQYYKSVAKECIHEYFEGRTESWLTEFSKKVIESKFLVYEVPEDEETATFARLNSGKIKATDSELVKCVMLTPQGDELPEVTLERVTEWDYMERTLDDNRFHAFLAHINMWKADDRMTLLFRYAGFMPSAKQQKNETHPFLACLEETLKGKTRTEVWRKISFTFSQMRYWFLHSITCHAVGWYIHCGFADAQLVLADVVARVEEYVRLFKEKSKEDVELYVNNSNKEYARRILLLFNVAWCWKRGDLLYDWSRHRNVGTWSLEHIFARNQKDLSKEEFNEFCLGCESAKWQEYVEYTKRDEGDVYLARVLGDVYPQETEDNSLRNLALVGRNTNSALNNSLFTGKVVKLDERITCKAEFVPPATEAVFHKQFPEMAVGSPYFSENDKEKYLKFMHQTIKEFMKELEKHV